MRQPALPSPPPPPPSFSCPLRAIHPVDKLTRAAKFNFPLSNVVGDKSLNLRPVHKIDPRRFVWICAVEISKRLYKFYGTQFDCWGLPAFFNIKTSVGIRRHKSRDISAASSRACCPTARLRALENRDGHRGRKLTGECWLKENWPDKQSFHADEASLSYWRVN